MRLICAQGQDSYIYIYTNMYKAASTGNRPRFPSTYVHRFIACGRTWVPQAPAAEWSFTSIQMVHTQTPRGGADNESEMTMKMRWKLLNQDAKRGTQKKRERANTNTTHLAQSEQTLTGQGKETEADGNGTRPAKEGEDGSAWTNLPQRNLSLPKHAQDPTYL